MIPLFDERERIGNDLGKIYMYKRCAMKRGALNTNNKERWSLFSKKRTKVVALFFFVCYSPPSASRPHLAMNDFDDDDDDDDFDDI